MSVGSLKQVDLTHEVTDLNDVPYLTFGQEIQSKRNLLRYYGVVSDLVTDKGNLAKGEGMPLPHSSYVNILVDDPEMDFYSPKFITYPKSSSKVNRFGNDLDQLKLDIEQEFVSIIKRIRSELKIEGSGQSIDATKIGIGASGAIRLDPRQPSTFITDCIRVLGIAKGLGVRSIGGQPVHAYDIALPYFH